jgi:hypothetical protein
MDRIAAAAAAATRAVVSAPGSSAGDGRATGAPRKQVPWWNWSTGAADVDRDDRVLRAELEATGAPGPRDGIEGFAPRRHITARLNSGTTSTPTS